MKSTRPKQKPIPPDLMQRWFAPLDTRPKLSETTSNLKPGESIVVRVLHLDHCAYWDGMPCGCDPDVSLDSSLPAMEITRFV